MTALTGKSGQGSTGFAGSVTIPATALVGDLMLLFITTSDSSHTVVGPTSGWTPVTSQASTGSQASALYKRTCVAGDPGSSVTIPRQASGNFPWSAQIRCYTCGGIDHTITGFVLGSGSSTTYAPLSPTEASASDWAIAFYGVNQDITLAFTAGGSNSLITQGTNAFADSASEDWVGAPSGGTLSTGSGAGTIVQIAVSLVPSIVSLSSSASDSWSISDSAAIFSGATRAANDSWSVGDAVVLGPANFSRPVAESWTVADQAPTVGFNRTVADAFSISDSPVRTGHAQRGAADSFTVADATRVFWAPYVDLPTNLLLDPWKKALVLRGGGKLALAPGGQRLALQDARSRGLVIDG